MANKTKPDDSRIDAANEIYNIAQERANAEIVELKEKQARIAKAHEFAGRIQAFKFVRKVVSVTTLIQLQQIKESKVYRDLPNIETWDKYCEYLGFSREKIDKDLANLATFGEQFLGTVTSLGVGYRDLRKLRQLAHDGTVTIDAEAVVIGDERIPLDQDHREDLQAAIEKIIDEQAQVKAELSAQKKAFDRVQTDTHKSMTKLQKDLDKFTAAAQAKGLTADEDAFMQRMELHRISAQGAMIALEPLELTKEFMDLSPKMIARAISIAHELKMQALALYDTMVSEIGNSVMNPEMIEDYARWEEENGFKL